MKNIYIYGADKQGRAVCSLLELFDDHRVIGFIDRNPELIGTAVCNRLVYNPEYVALMDEDILILIASRDFTGIRHMMKLCEHDNYCDAGKYIMLNKYARQFPLCMEHMWNSNRTHTSSMDGREDLIVEAIFNAVGIETPKYIDIGANHPIRSSNTYLFYLKGSNGIAVEPNSKQLSAWAELRPRDKFYNIGLSDCQADRVLAYYTGATIMYEKSLAEYYASIKGRMAEPLYVRQDVFNNIADKDVQFVDIDTDSVDMKILYSINFDSYPELLVICIEQRSKECIDFLNSRGFTLFCENTVNSIFIRDTIADKVFADKLCHEIFSWHKIQRLITYKPDYYLPLW